MAIDFNAAAAAQTLPTPGTMVVLFTNAIAACSINQDYFINGRHFTRADLGELHTALAFWKQQLALASNVSDTTVARFTRF